jgi:hypothetical protein
MECKAPTGTKDVLNEVWAIDDPGWSPFLAQGLLSGSQLVTSYDNNS